MKAVLIRTTSGSVPIHSPSFIFGSPRVSISVHNSLSGIFSGDKTSPRICLHSNVNRRPIRRSVSESDMINLENVAGSFRGLTSVRSQLFPAQIPEEEYVSDSDEVVLGDIGIGSGLSNYSREWPGSEIPAEELGFSSDGIGKGSISGGVSGSGGNSDRRMMGAYYEEMLKTDPTNSLLLTNYGKFLYEVEGDTVKAEEYYGRAILATPGDGEMLSMYGKLIWEIHRDEDRAKSYFDRAVDAAPDDCMVLGSYAQFMWEIEEDEDDEDEEEVMETESIAVMSPAAVIEAF